VSPTPPDDAGEPEGEDADADLGCAPRPVASSFAPAYVPSGGLRQARCTDALVDQIISQCFGGDPVACNDLITANQDCFDCILPDETSPVLGAIVHEHGTDYVGPNVAGCVAAAVGDTTCAAKIQAVDACEVASCELACPVDGGRDFQGTAALHACYAAADNSACKSYLADIGCVDALLAGPAAVCDVGLSEEFPTVFKRYGKLFCGGASDDGGVNDAGGDAAVGDAATDG
jgi:hypothetical protein